MDNLELNEEFFKNRKLKSFIRVGQTFVDIKQTIGFSFINDPDGLSNLISIVLLEYIFSLQFLDIRVISKFIFLIILSLYDCKKEYKKKFNLINMAY